MTSKKRVYYGKLRAAHPSVYIEDDLEYFELTPEELAERCGIDIGTLQLLLDAEIPMTRELGEKLQPLTGIDPDMWMRLQHKYEERLAEIEQAKARDRELSKLQHMRRTPEPVTNLASVSA